MKRIATTLAVLATLALAGSALATTTWSHPDGLASLGTTTTGTESAPTLASEGFDLSGVGGFSVYVESVPAGDGGSVPFTAGTLLGYVYNPVSGKWGRATDLDCAVAAGTSYACPGYTVTSARGRVAFAPSGLGTPVKVFIVGTRAR